MTAHRADTAFDVVLDGIGLTLARQGQMGSGARAYSSETVGASILQQTPEGQPYGNQPSIVEIPVVFSDVSLGYGEERRIHERRYYYSENIDARFPGMILPGPYVHPLTLDMGSVITGFFEQAGHLYVLGGRYCKKIAENDSISVDKAFDFDEASTDLVTFDSDVYVAMGLAENLWQRSEAGVWTQSPDMAVKHLALFSDRIWASTSENTVGACDYAPLWYDNWTADYTVGGAARPITGMCEMDTRLFVGKTDGLYALTSAGIAVQLIPEVASAIDDENCRALHIWHASLIVPHLRGLFRFQSSEDGNIVQVITPGADAPKTCPVVGRITAMVGDSRWLYAAMLTRDGHTYILAGREAESEEPATEPMIWHPIAKIISKTCRAMHISGLWDNPRLFLGCGDDCAYIILPRSTDNPYFDQNCRYAQSGSIYFPSHSLGSAYTAKVFKSLEVKGRHIHPSRRLRAYYKADGHSWVSAGEVTTGPKFIAALATPGVAAYQLQLRLDAQIKTFDQPFVVESYSARGAERPRTIEVITITVRCADDIRLKNGGRDRRSGREIYDLLKERETIQESVIFRDRMGLERRVLLLPPITLREGVALQGESPEDLAQVRLAVFEADTTSASDYGYHAASVWDGDDIWYEGEVFTWGTSMWGSGDYWGS